MDTNLPGSKRSKLIIADHWRFQFDQDNRGEKESWFDPVFPITSWGNATVPGAWNLTTPALWAYDGPVWYAVDIPSSAVKPELRQCLIFQRVSSQARVWLNGRYLGEHYGGDLPFQFEVSHILSTESVNRLVLRVESTPRPDLPPGTPIIERVVYGGILKPVILEKTAQTYIESVWVYAHLQGANALVTCEIHVAGSHLPLQGRLVASISNISQTIVSGWSKVDYTPGEQSTFELKLTVENAKTWSPDHPDLYGYSVRLEDNSGVLIDETDGHFGVRKIETRGREILLNGEPIVIKGVNRYDEFAGCGPVATNEMMRADLLMIKRSGANFIRVHYPQDPELLDLLDEIGLMIMEEVFINWWGSNFWAVKVPTTEENNQTVIPAAECMLEELIQRDFNHPCVIAWSMANESATQEPAGIAGMRRLIQRAKTLDATRLVTFVANGDVRKHLAFEEADLVCANNYAGVFDTLRAYHAADFEERVTLPIVATLESFAAHFNKPIIITEYGCHGIEGFHGDARFSEDYQAAYIQTAWNAIRSVQGVQGGVLWSWADYHHRHDFSGAGLNAPFGPFGVVTVDRRKKKAYASLCSMYGGEKE